jgi:hypothetical protein
MSGREGPDLFPQGPVALGRARLAGEGIAGLGDLGDDVLEPDEILLGVGEHLLGQALLVFIVSGPGGFFDQGPLLNGLTSR